MMDVIGFGSTFSSVKFVKLHVKPEKLICSKKSLSKFNRTNLSYLSRVSCTLTEVLLQVSHGQSILDGGQKLITCAASVIGVEPIWSPPSRDDPLISRPIQPHLVDLKMKK